MAEYGRMSAIFLCVNAMIAAGMLSLPFVFYHGGIVAGATTFLVLAIPSIASTEWTLEAMARAEALYSWRETGSYHWPQNCPISTNRKFEVGDLCRIFIHRSVGILYNLLVALAQFFALCAYGNIAASALASVIPFGHDTLFRSCDTADFRNRIHPAIGGCWNSYAICVAMFGLIVIPLSCIKLQTQVVFQNFMGLLRLAVVLTMIFWSAITPPIGDEDLTHRSWIDFNFQNWLAVFPLSISSLSMQFMLPTFCQYVRDKSSLGFILKIATAIVILLDVGLGIAVAFHFQGDIAEMCTLNWYRYSKAGNSLFSRTLAYFLLLYPSMDLCSTYPLIATLGSNIFLALLQDAGVNTEARHFALITRFCFATLPLIGSIYVANTVVVSIFVGFLYILITLVIPSLLRIFSIKKCQALFGTQTETATLLENKQLQQSDIRKTLYPPLIGRSDLLAYGTLLLGVMSLFPTVASWIVSKK
ncbi:transmembrane protein 104 homolog isoform X1 [Oscarella lobularis]|uniref:transmembrane protein 104 homolog isoform X1 n=1 Tax=Oscarella lobularis TaxID=121494 RepID=UPI0033140A17